MSSTISFALPKGWVISPRLMACWPIDAEHTLEISPIERTDDGRIRWGYRLARRNRTVFAGRDLCSAVGAAVTTDEYTRTARTALAFLTLRPGDVEAGYFAGYTKRQLTWRDDVAEDLALLAMDDQCGYCGSEGHVSPVCPSRRAPASA